MKRARLLAVLLAAGSATGCLTDFRVRFAPPPCQTHADCPERLACVDGRCVEGARPCDYDDECPRDEVCADWLCATPTCDEAPLCLVPTSSIVAPGGVVRFVATAPAAPDTPVVFAAGGVVGGDAANGTIDRVGTYTAPLAASAGQSFVVSAWTADAPQVKVFAGVTIATPAWELLAGPRGGAVDTLTVLGADEPVLLASPKDSRAVFRRPLEVAAWTEHAGGWSDANSDIGAGGFARPDPLGARIWFWRGIYHSNQLYFSNDAGLTWTRLAPPAATGDYISCVFASPTRVFVGLHLESSLYLSGNDGEDWRQVVAPGAAAGPCEGGAISPFDPARVLYSSNGELWQSDDTGESFTLAASDQSLPDGYAATAIVFHPTLAGRVYAAFSAWDAAVLFRSDDDGETWQHAADLPPAAGTATQAIFDLAVSVGQSALYAGTRDGLYRGDLSASSWNRIALLDRVVATLEPHPSRPEVLFAGLAGQGFFRSDDAGFTWRRESHGLNRVPVTTLLPAGGGLVFAGTRHNYGGGALWRSTDHLRHAAPIVDGPPDGSVYALAAGGGRLFAATLQDYARGGLYRSNDRGVTWQALLPEVSESGLRCVSAAGAVVLGTSTDYGDDLALAHRSSDGGETWSVVEIPLAANSAARGCAVFAQRPLVQLISTNEPSIQRTDDGWQTFAPASFSPLLDADESLSHLWASPHDGLAFATSSYGSSYRSTDYGASWTLMPEEPFSRINSLAFHPSSARAEVVLVAAEDTDGIFVSQDQGLTWTLLPGSDIGSTLAVAIDPDDPSLLYVGTDAGTLLGRGAPL